VTYAETESTLPDVREDRFLPSALLREVAASARPHRLSFPDGHRGWLVSDYATARAVLADRRFIIGVSRQPRGTPGKLDAFHAALGPLAAGAITSKDPPEHTRLRRAVGDRFSAVSVEGRAESIEGIVRGQLAALESAGRPADLLTVFARPIPSRVICDVLGVPHSDQDQFIGPTDLILSPSGTPDDVTRAFAEFSEYVRGVVAAKRAHRGDDLLSDLVHGTNLSADEICGLALELFVTGHETTAGLITLGTMVLLEDRSRWERLRQQPELMDTAIEELLRYITVVEIGFARTAVEDAQIGGVTIAAGETVAVSLHAANHDPAHFTAPETVQLDRADASHLALGHGIHRCLGQSLAKLELRIALTGLMRRFPTLRLAVSPSEVPLECTDVGVYRANELPVTW